MNSKERFYSGVARETIHRLTSNVDSWLSFLQLMGRNYEFTYPEQVMIYAQRPDAIFCRTYEEWNNDEFKRYIRRGSKGIALFVSDSSKPSLRYVFDVSDTGTRRSSPDLNIWRVTEEYQPLIHDMLERAFEVESEGTLERKLETLAQKLTNEYWDEFEEQFFDILENSFLEEYDRDNIGMAFRNAVSVSATYALYLRCTENPDEYFEQADFQNVFDFNTRQTVNALGTAVNAITSRVYKEIERVLEEYEKSKDIERGHYNERNELYENRGLSDSGHAVKSDRTKGTGQVRTDEERVPEEPPTDDLQRHDSGRDVIPASVGSSGDSDSQKETDDVRIADPEPGTRQKDQADGMGKTHEHVRRTSGRDDSDGDYQQLSLNLFLSEDEQISFIDFRAESQKPSAFSFEQSEIDHILQFGSNSDESRKRIATEFMKQKSLGEITDFLKGIYYGGFGIKDDNRNVASWYDEDGIHLAKGNAARDVKGAQIISWEAAAERIGQLLETGQFASNVELAEAPGYERKKLAETVWYLYHDLSKEARDRGHLQSIKEIRGKGFPDVTAGLADLLKDTEFISRLISEFERFLVEWRNDKSLLRFRNPNPEEVIKRLRDLELPRREFTTDMTELPKYRYYITDDELNLAIIGGSGFAGGKNRIYDFFDQSHTQKEKVDFLKNAYGTGGRSHALSRSTGSDEWHDAKGMVFKKIGCENVKLSWTQVASRIENLIKKEQYLTPKEKGERQAVLEAKGDDICTDSLQMQGNEQPEREISGTLSEEAESFEKPTIEQMEEPLVIPAEDFKITDEHLGEGGPKQKYTRNIEAIRILFTLEKENRNATSEEQEKLSQYVGWGGLADAFDKDKSSWEKEYEELKNLLPEREYEMARASTLNAHYTSPAVIRAMYDAIVQMGFTSGNVLEPSMGIGNFFGMLPEEMRNSRLYGVELDSISGRIAQKLYPNADITVAGFETIDRRDFFDLAIGNVPFGNYKVSDKPYDKLGFSIHNYFFAKALDQVRPGGIIAFVTSHYTMDQKTPDVRKYLAQRAELLGAIRLPNNAFKANAGAEVVSDIIFLQKRDHPIDIEPDWVHLGMTPQGHSLNSYFVEYPEMILGELTTQFTQYGKDECTVVPRQDLELSEQLKEAITHIHGKYKDVEFIEPDMKGAADTIPADPNVKNFSYTVVDEEVYFRENSVMRRCDLNDTAKDRIIGMVQLRQIVNELIEYQLEDYSDEEIRSKQRELDAKYDSFIEKYELINARANAQVFSEDSSYYLLCSLENLDENGELESKADMFNKRTIRPEVKVSRVDTPSEALAISIGERGGVDLSYMAELLGTESFDDVIDGLKGVIFKDPMGPEEIDKGWQTADEYLSGNVRDKLRIAKVKAVNDSRFKINVEALEKTQPKDLDASEIDVRLGATWIDRMHIQDFMEETFHTPYYLRSAIEVNYSPFTAEWQITGKSRLSSKDVNAYVTYGTDRANAYRILEDTLNLKDVRIYDVVDEDGKEKRVLNKRETMLAQQKQQAIKDAFQDWIWKDPYRRQELVKIYNERFNSTRPREYDGSHIRFGGMNPDIKLRSHQLNAIAHVLYGGNTLLAHEVGAGKTFEMAASAMESKRLGLCQKSMFVVPNHLTLQWANEFLRLYPSAKLLVATKKDFETAKRKKFCARIATGDYDAVIIGHSQFEKIPISAERQERLLQDQIREVINALDELKRNHGENFSIKQMEKTKKSLQARLDKLTSAERKDDVITFEQLGVDRLFVDESHAYKNLFLYTKMRNMAGLSTSEAQKSSDMFMKCRYMDEITGGRGVIFATGTPVSNSMTELYTVMRYLQYSTLQQKKLTHFDCWASTFGETTTAIELAPEGTGYRARTRFAKFFNLPELMNMFKEVADIKTSDQLNLPVPEAKFETVVVQPSDIQKEMVKSLSERAAMVHGGSVDPSVDNMLKITSDGRKIGLDQRLMNPMLPDDPNSKLNACVKNVIRIWEDGKDDKLTQLLFCDLSTPKNDDTFNVYDDVRKKLVEHGIPMEEIAFIHNADTEAKKKELFSKVRSGQVRVLLGSTQKMGAGTNVQDRLVAVHHLDVGWRPSDMTQRNGRIIRQGNKNKEVQIYQYVTEGTFDAYLYQTLENKQKFISQIMTSKSPVRSCDDVDEQALSYAEIKALCAGNPLIKEKMDLDIEVARLKVLKADHQSKQFRLEDQLLKYFPAEIERHHEYIRCLEKDIAIVALNPIPKEDFIGMIVGEKSFSEKEMAGEAILAACKNYKGTEPIPVGEYRGFKMELTYDSFHQEFSMILKGSMSHKVKLGSDARGNLIRLDNALNNIPNRLVDVKTKLENLENQQKAAKTEIGKPFPQEKELTVKSARLAELDAELNMDDRNSPKTKEERSSVLADLKQRVGQILPERHKSSEYEEVL